MLCEAFYWLFNASISASIAGIVIWLLGKIKKIPRRLVHLLWAIPFIRMWMPVGVSGKYSLMTLISKFTTKTVRVYEGPLDLTLTNHVMAAEDYSPITFKMDLVENVFRIASVIWIIIAFVLIVIFAVAYLMTISELSASHHLRENIYVSDKVTAPATYGVFRPRIMLPKEYAQCELKFILAHERAHIRGKDNLWRILAIATVCVHWFNPFAWLFLKKFLEETELACDERVLAHMGVADKKAYATALVNCAQSSNVFASAFGGAAIRVRIDRILSYRRLSALSAISFAMLAAAIGYVLLTNAS